ncbi:MAG: NUDIX hydrolase [Gammaproteobacteria bacterium]|nr:NUDIX hydrolase [Gammaproteobacteria bacterium]
MRPRDAATLILTRDNREVLLGVRSAGHVFMPHMYVFPGGRVDAGDARVASPFGLSSVDVKKLTRSTSAARARALAMTAVRETFEETGLILGHKQDPAPRSRSPHWQPFFQTGYVPALDKMQYVARAITPPGGVRRYDARFFLADARDVSGQLKGNGELEDLRWVSLDQALDLPLSPITELVLELLGERLRGARGDWEHIPLYRSLFGKELVEHE